MNLIGILGGTFDPIHNGHIQLALEAQAQLSLDQVRFIPVNIPPHRESPIASSDHRLQMIEQAIEDKPVFYIDRRELESENTSYSIDTLKSLRKEFPDDSLCLIMGRDAFNKFDSWKDWQELLDYAHIIVANRPNEAENNISNELNTWINKHQTNDKTEIENTLSGKIYFISIPMLDISSSMIRQCYKEEKTVEDLLPATTQTYIKQNNLYLDTA
jgi:nicotinate-nucleotide adenylyltransferase